MARTKRDRYQTRMTPVERAYLRSREEAGGEGSAATAIRRVRKRRGRLSPELDQIGPSSTLLGQRYKEARQRGVGVEPGAVPERSKKKKKKG